MFQTVWLENLYWFCQIQCELPLILVLLEEGCGWTCIRSVLTGTLISFHQLVGIPAYL